jgi:hypothetical protein
MRVLLSAYGSRGDAQPGGTAVALQRRGAEALVCAPPDAEFTDRLDRAGVPLAPAFASVHQWIEMAKQSGLSLPSSLIAHRGASEMAGVDVTGIRMMLQVGFRRSSLQDFFA